MKAPARRPADARSSIYGVGDDSINRRGLIAAALAATVAGRADATAARPATAMAGGRSIDPRRIAALTWRGTATVAAGGRRLDLDLTTHVEPFVRAASRSWIVAAGEGSARTLIVEPDGAWVAREGVRTPLPPRQAAHERQQYALYGHLLAARGFIAAPPVRGMDGRAVPPPRFVRDAAGVPVGGRYVVDAPDRDGTVEETLTLAGLAPGCDFWPARLRLASEASVFELTIAAFDVELSADPG